MNKTILYKTKLEAAKLYLQYLKKHLDDDNYRLNVQLLVAEFFNISCELVAEYSIKYIGGEFSGISEYDCYYEYKKLYKKKKKSKFFVDFRRSDINLENIEPLGIEKRMVFIFQYYENFSPKFLMSLNYLSAIFGVSIFKLRYWFKKFKERKKNQLPLINSKTSKISDHEKINIVEFYLNNKKNMTQKIVAQKFNLKVSELAYWLKLYKTNKLFLPPIKNPKISDKEKANIVEFYLNNKKNMTQKIAAQELNITISQLYYCLRLYKINKLQLQNVNLTTLEISDTEKINIVKFYLDNKKNMTQKSVAQKYNIKFSKLSYWLRLYKKKKLTTNSIVSKATTIVSQPKPASNSIVSKPTIEAKATTIVSQPKPASNSIVSKPTIEAKATTIVSQPKPASNSIVSKPTIEAKPASNSIVSKPTIEATTIVSQPKPASNSIVSKPTIEATTIVSQPKPASNSIVSKPTIEAKATTIVSQPKPASNSIVSKPTIEAKPASNSIVSKPTIEATTIVSQPKPASNSIVSKPTIEATIEAKETTIVSKPQVKSFASVISPPKVEPFITTYDRGPARLNSLPYASVDVNLTYYSDTFFDDPNGTYVIEDNNDIYLDITNQMLLNNKLSEEDFQESCRQSSFLKDTNIPVFDTFSRFRTKTYKREFQEFLLDIPAHLQTDEPHVWLAKQWLMDVELLRRRWVDKEDFPLPSVYKALYWADSVLVGTDEWDSNPNLSNPNIDFTIKLKEIHKIFKPLFLLAFAISVSSRYSYCFELSKFLARHYIKESIKINKERHNFIIARKTISPNKSTAGKLLEGNDWRSEVTRKFYYQQFCRNLPHHNWDKSEFVKLLKFQDCRWFNLNDWSYNTHTFPEYL